MLGARCSRSQAVLAAKRRRRTRCNTGTATTRNTASAVPPRTSRRCVSTGVNMIGAANVRNAKIIPPPMTLTSTAPQIQRLKVLQRNGSLVGTGSTAHSGSTACRLHAMLSGEVSEATDPTGRACGGTAAAPSVAGYPTWRTRPHR